MMQDPKRLYCVAFKQNERFFEIYSRKYKHAYKLHVNEKPMDIRNKAMIYMESLNSIIMCSGSYIRFYDTKTYEEHLYRAMSIPLQQTNSYMKNEIVKVQKS